MHSTSSLFGTDGIRGTVNQPPMLPQRILALGMAVGLYLRNRNFDATHRIRVLIAKDTRLSGYLLESSLTAGLSALGVDVILVGPMPTAAVPMLVKSLRMDFGIMITASHNPYHDNGLKLFSHLGHKLSDSDEQTVRNLLHDDNLDESLAAPDKLGKVIRLDDAPGRYIEYVKGTFPRSQTLNGLRVVIDCANGAGYKIAPIVLWELGAEVINVGCKPNGTNINDNCGAMHPSLLSQRVIESRADIGLALDGDGDRLLICDEQGNTVSGDHVIAFIAQSWLRKGKLRGNGIVLTKMSNSATPAYLSSIGLKTWYSEKVGDRHVADKMREHACNVGGESSGHIILSDFGSTGDGIVAALQVLTALREMDSKASQISEIFTLNPQVLENIHFVANNNPLDKVEAQDKLDAIMEKNRHLKIIVRKSGTENVVRVLVEGQDKKEARDIMAEIITALEQG